MPSSISSSKAAAQPNERSSARSLPAMGGARVWALALLLTVLLLGLMEVRFRDLGYRPSITDDMRLWSVQREQATADTTRPLVLLGASRIQLGFDLNAFRRAYPGRNVYQLAIDGRHPLAVLQDLASDDNFNGDVIIAARAESFLPRSWPEQAPYVRYFRTTWSADKKMNLLIGEEFQEILVLRGANLSLRRLASFWMANRALPPINYLITDRHRERRADYSGPAVAAIRQARLQKIRAYARTARVPSPEEWLAAARQVEPLVEDIERRGGRVAFVRFPTAGEHWEIDQKLFPKGDYWDRFAARSGVLSIHFADYPALGSYTLPDLSHLDMRDKGAFTRTLLDILEAKGFFARP